MESLKPILLCVVLAGVGYGVYIALNHAPPPEPPLTSAPEWGKGPSVETGTPAGGSVDATKPASAKSGADSLPMRGASILEKVQQSNSGSASSSSPNSRASNSSVAAPSVSLPFGVGSSGLGAAGAQSSKNDSVAINRSTADAAAAPGTAGVAAPYVAAPPSANSVDAVARHEFASAMRSAQTLANDGKLVEALRELSRWYDHPAIAAEEQGPLLEMLSQLAGSVIYSQQHLLVPAYQVQPGDTLETVAMQYQVPWQLLAKINGIQNSRALTPGEKIKVLRGPFNAQLNCQQDCLALFVDGLYAGRFPIQGSRTLTKPDGSYPVAKFAADNPANSIRRPYISLGGDLYLFAPDAASPPTAGALGMGQRDMEDVFDMLSERSKVTIRR
jgi:LysM repeat protein